MKSSTYYNVILIAILISTSLILTDFVSPDSIGREDMASNSEAQSNVVNGVLLNPLLFPLIPSQAGRQNNLFSTRQTQNGDVSYIFSFSLVSEETGDSPITIEPESESEIIFSDSTVTTKLTPDDICLGLITPLVDPRILATVQADGGGVAFIDFNITPAAGGVTVFVQAVDITDCVGSNVNEELIADQFQFLLVPLVPGQAGVQNNLAVTNATPFGDVMIIWGLREEENFDGSSICFGLLVDILNFRTLFTIQADSNGDASSNIFVPGNAAGAKVFLQAVDLSSCTPSNLREETF